MLEDIKRELKKARESEKLIIVEGKKDKQSLQRLGFKNKKIFTLNNGKSIKRNIEIISGMSKQAIILTDFDKEGRQLYQKFKHEFSQIGVKIDNKLRNCLRKQISHIQGLASFIENQE